MVGPMVGPQDNRKSMPNQLANLWLGPWTSTGLQAATINCRPGHQWLDGLQNGSAPRYYDIKGSAWLGPSKSNHGGAQEIRNSQWPGPKTTPWLGNDNNDEFSPLRAKDKDRIEVLAIKIIFFRPRIELLANKLITSAKPRIALLADKMKFAAKGRVVGHSKNSKNFCSQGSNCWRSKRTFAGND